MVIDRNQESVLVIDIAIPSGANSKKKKYEKIGAERGTREVVKSKSEVADSSRSDVMVEQ